MKITYSTGCPEGYIYGFSREMLKFIDTKDERYFTELDLPIKDEDNSIVTKVTGIEGITWNEYRARLEELKDRADMLWKEACQFTCSEDHSKTEGEWGCFKYCPYCGVRIRK